MRGEGPTLGRAHLQRLFTHVENILIIHKTSEHSGRASVIYCNVLRLLAMPLSSVAPFNWHWALTRSTVAWRTRRLPARPQVWSSRLMFQHLFISLKSLSRLLAPRLISWFQCHVLSVRLWRGRINPAAVPYYWIFAYLNDMRKQTCRG